MLRVDKLEISYQNNYSNGVYITDYSADGLLINNKYNDYSNLIKEYNKITLRQGNNLRINGIIKTNYKQILKPLYDLYNENKSILEELEKIDNYKYYDYLINALSCGYSFNEDFIYSDELPFINIPFLKLNEKMNYRYLHYQPCYELPENTLIIPYSYVTKIYPKFSVDEARNYLKTNEFILQFFNAALHEYDTPRLNRIINVELTCDYRHLYKKYNLIDESCAVSKDLFDIFRKERFSTIGYYFDNNDVYKLNKIFKENNIKLDNPYAIIAESIEHDISRFTDVFKILDMFCIALCLSIMIYYAFSVIKENKYNIGVLKSLGYTGNELSYFYLSSFIIYFIITSIFYALIYNNLANLLNNVLVYRLTNGYGMDKLKSVPFVTFTSSIFISVSFFLLISSLLFSLIYLFVLRKYKIINVIQNKE